MPTNPPHRNRILGWLLRLGLAPALIGAAACSDDSTRPGEGDPEPIPDPLISGMLARTTGLGDGTQLQDDVLVWIDGDALGAITALKLAGRIDDEPTAAPDGGWNFALLSELDVPLFTPGDAVTIEMLGAAGGTRATLVCSTPAPQLDVLVPTSGSSVSLDGFTLTWSGGGADATAIIEISSTVLDHSWSVTTENDGAYRLDAADLEGFPRGGCRIRVSAWSDTALTSVELGVGRMNLIMAGETRVRLTI